MEENDRLEIEAEIVTIEEEILPDLRKQLAFLTAPDYDPSQNDDDNLREEDIEFYESEIYDAEEKLRHLNRRLNAGR